MHKIYHIAALFVLLSWTLTACLPKPIDIEIEPPEQELVIASQLIPNQFMLIAVTRSFSALAIDGDNDTVTPDFLNNLLVDRARVTVSYPGNTDQLLPIGGGIYASVNTLQVPNEVYTLRVEDTLTGKSVSASTRMLSFVPFDTVTPFIERDGADTTIFLDYTIQDLAGDNWYVINVVKRGDGSGVGIDLNSFFSAGLNVSTQTVLLSDQTFSGSTHSARLELENVVAQDSIAVTLSNVSQEYYEFLQQQERAQGLLSQITQEPINRSTNVEGGYGFFNAHFPDIRIYDLNDF